MIPGGGRSPSTQPPPSPPVDGQHRPTRDRRPSPSSRVISFSVLRWGVLIGGLVIIADLATKAIIQNTVSPDDALVVEAVDQMANWVLYAILGIAITRETGLIYSGALAGLVASLLDAILVAAANWLTPPVSPMAEIQALFIQNVVTGTAFAAVSGFVYAAVQRWSGGRRPR